ncbi:MAG: HPr family phosphocarrier protein [Verrucomicrobiaceae bacterium]
MTFTKEFTVINKMGMHARPAAQFVKLAGKFKCEVWVEKDDEQVNGKSIMGLMMLAAGQGAKLLLTTDGLDAESALKELGSLIECGFDDGE